jgi:hypothetical protein
MSDYGERKKPSLVDYSKVSDRPFERVVQPSGPHIAATTTATATAAMAPTASSAQMDAVTRLLTGRQERTIAEKMADSNRPTWEQYKKDNHDKLNLDSLDQKQMEEYRRQLDAERDPRLAGLKIKDKKNHKKSHKKHKKSSSRQRRKRHREDESDSENSSRSSASETESSSSSSRERKRKRKHRHRKDKKKRSHRRDDDDSDRDKSDRKRPSKEENGNDDHDEHHNDHHRKKHKKHKSATRNETADSDGEHYRLSNFFAETASNDD